MSQVSPLSVTSSASDPFALFQQEVDGDRRNLRRALAAAVAAHLALLAVSLPEVRDRPLETATPDPVFVVERVRLKPPVRPPEEVPVRRGPRRPVPAVDPTIDLLPVEASPLPLDLPPLDLALPVLAPPPAPAPVVEAPVDELMVVGQGVAPPVRIHFVEPRYPEVARRAGVEGAVILRLVVDRHGETHSIEVLKGLPFGLTESAIAAVERWRFEPSTFRGRPVDVLYTLTVRFGVR